MTPSLSRCVSMACHAWWFFPSAPLATRVHCSFKCERFSKSNLSCCINYGTDATTHKVRRWYNPDRQKRVYQPEIVRYWIEADNPPIFDSKEKFIVVSYNILGDKNASNHRELYSHVVFHYIQWERRKRLICQELIGWKPDIICLQEVDRYYDLLSIMEKNGYAGSYKRRTGQATDGCALFWRATTQMCRADSRRVLVGNIHVLFNPSRGDIKLGQIRLLLQRAHALSEKWGNIPVVLVGDFNSTPQSTVYKFLSSSEVNIATGIPNRTIVEHPLKLNSSYLTVKGSARTRGSHGEPLATTYHSRFLGTVDYLWYSDGLFPTRVLDTPPVDMLRKTGGLPSKKLGSDHLALVSEFAFKKAEGKLKPTPYQDPHQTSIQQLKTNRLVQVTAKSN